MAHKAALIPPVYSADDPTMASLVGQPAPFFELQGSDGKKHPLTETLGHVTVLFFYVGDNTPTCRAQLVTYNDVYKNLQSSGVKFMGISPDNEETHYAFTCRLDLRFPLLVDEDRAVAKQYDVIWPMGIYRRSTFVLDHEGILRYESKTSFGGFLSHRSTQDALDVAQELVDAMPKSTPAPVPAAEPFEVPRYTAIK